MNGSLLSSAVYTLSKYKYFNFPSYSVFELGWSQAVTQKQKYFLDSGDLKKMYSQNSKVKFNPNLKLAKNVLLNFNQTTSF